MWCPEREVEQLPALSLSQQTSKQQRTFGSFYLAIDQPLSRPLLHRLYPDLIGFHRVSQTNMYKLLTHGHGIIHRRIRRWRAGLTGQRHGQQEGCEQGHDAY
ncbi:hypothetical protein BFG06_06270 [Aeromonas caviae]|nr:hypothetical protein BFG06_06270 [Aeromonas caviae]